MLELEGLIEKNPLPETIEDQRIWIDYKVLLLVQKGWLLQTQSSEAVQGGKVLGMVQVVFGIAMGLDLGCV